MTAWLASERMLEALSSSGVALGAPGGPVIPPASLLRAAASSADELGLVAQKLISGGLDDPCTSNVYACM